MRDSCGTGGQVRHLKVKRPNVAHRLPRGKRASGTDINTFKSIEAQQNKNRKTISPPVLHHLLRLSSTA
ncbi:hypothetical protein [Fictibacillus sp. UD]|uniref:hypothetical protein n=1 Tax=Fictibacillus sp. UD TaxID=3038777 RepID=UPI003749450E